MFSIITGSIILSVLHAMIPNHWLPIIAIGRKEKWPVSEVTEVTFISAIAHGLSTVILGFILGYLGAALSERIEYFTHFMAPAILILLGIFFIYRHHHHKHFHINDDIKKKKSKKKIIVALVLAMFLSPCMEIEAYFFISRNKGKMAYMVYSGIVFNNHHAGNGNAGKVSISRNFKTQLAFFGT